MKTFREFTLLNSDQCEVMVNIDAETGAIIGLYCYADNLPIIEDIETGRLYNVKVKEGKNPLFVHIQSKKDRYFRLLQNGWLILLDEQDQEYERDVEIIQKSLSFYNGEPLNNIY